MPNADAPTVAKLLREYAQRTALRGGNPYRAKAYSRAADNLTAHAEPLEKVIVEGRLTEIPGIGEAIADIVTKNTYGTVTFVVSSKIFTPSPSRTSSAE
jgi:DNA polymerase (family X)